jgi:hypothetical protein
VGRLTTLFRPGFPVNLPSSLRISCDYGVFGGGYGELSAGGLGFIVEALNILDSLLRGVFHSQRIESDHSVSFASTDIRRPTHFTGTVKSERKEAGVASMTPELS